MGFKKTISLAVAALLDSSVLVRADQPVHCKLKVVLILYLSNNRLKRTSIWSLELPREFVI